MITIRRLLMFLFAVVFLPLVMKPAAPLQADIRLDPGTRYQTITGWEVLAQAGQVEGCVTSAFVGDPITCPAFQNYRDTLYDALVHDLGINRVRVEMYPGMENTTDYYTQFLQGQITERDWVHVHAHEIINDNDDPNVINPSGFHWGMLDHQMATVVLPLKQRLEARGERLFINVCYVDFRSDPAQFQHYNNPLEYAEFVLATYQHMQARYGLVPDTWEVELEPDNTPFDGFKMGAAMRATAARLEAAGFTPRFVVPSTTSMANAQPYFNAIRNVIGDGAVRQYVAELSYHRYTGVSDVNLAWIADTAQALGIDAAMLEHIGSGYESLHQDLTLGQNTAWAQYAIATPYFVATRDDGAAYYLVDDRDVRSPNVIMGSRTRFLRQYFRFIRAGAVRIGATGTGTFDPVAFINRGGGYVVVVKAERGGAFTIGGLPAGTYGLKYTTSDAYDVDLPDVALGSGQVLGASIPARGVITVYARTGMMAAPASSDESTAPDSADDGIAVLPETSDATDVAEHDPAPSSSRVPPVSQPDEPGSPSQGTRLWDWLEQTAKSIWDFLKVAFGGD